MFVKGVLKESSCDSVLIFIMFLEVDMEKVKQIKSWKENWQDSVNCVFLEYALFIYISLFDLILFMLLERDF